MTAFVSLSHRERVMLLEAYLLLGWARVLKYLPFSKIAPSLGEFMTESTYLSKEKDIEIIKSVKSSIEIMSKYTFWESQCLVKAIAGMKMLRSRGIESTLYLGTGREEDKLIAHAWLRSGSLYISGAEGMEKFTVVGKFTKKINGKGEKNDSQTEA
jgi:Transglutaminase-like superfamily